MFSGIIDAVGVVDTSSATPGGRRLTVAAEGYWAVLADGASVAIDGVCLTVTEVRGNQASFDVIEETLRRTTLGGLRSGDRVNLQKSLAVGDRVDGHFVQGHVDAVAAVSRVDKSGGEAMWWFEPDPSALPYIIPKGSVAIDGISLTVVDVTDARFSVALIPTTLARTTLGDKAIGSRVNIETDILARTVVQTLQSMRDRGESRLSLDTLRRAGFE